MRPFPLLTGLALLGTAGAQTIPLTGTTWTLSRAVMGGQEFQIAPGATAPSLRLDGRDATGTTGCNSLWGPYNLRNDAFRFGPLATTRQDCPSGLAGRETQLLNTLRGVTRFEVGNGTLTLFAADRDRLVFRSGRASSAPESSAPEAPMKLDGTWTLSGGTALRPVVGSLPSLTFAGGRLSGTGGCNRLTSSFRLEGEKLSLEPVASTRMLCAPAVNNQEAALLRFLGGGVLRTQVQGNELTLTDTAGKTLIFRRASAGGGDAAGELDAGAAQQGSYTLATMDGQAAPRTAQPVTLTLSGDRLSGSDGCNLFSAPTAWTACNWFSRASTLSTLRACPDQPNTVNLPALLAARPTLIPTATGLTLQAEGTTLTFTRS